MEKDTTPRSLIFPAAMQRNVNTTGPANHANGKENNRFVSAAMKSYEAGPRIPVPDEDPATNPFLAPHTTRTVITTTTTTTTTSTVAKSSAIDKFEERYAEKKTQERFTGKLHGFILVKTQAGCVLLEDQSFT
jgi:hypothetical protein